ncbi:MAG: FAD-dependent thymidylate synthase [Elainella sp.]
MDRFFKVEVLSQTPAPQQTIYAAMHQDYAESFVWDERDRFPSEAEAGEIIVKHLLAGNRGHYGPLEHPQIVLNCGFFPHSTMQQIRTHRVGVSFDVQCLAGDTEVTFLHASGGLRKIKISRLYELWANGENVVRERKIRGRNGELPGRYRRDCKTRLQKMKLRVLNEQTGIFEIGHIQHVFDQGTQPVYRLTLEDGKILDCTENHRLFTRDGWQTMQAALGLITDSDRQVVSYSQDCYLMANGVVVEELEFAQNFVPITALSDKPKPVGRKLKAHPVKVVQVKYLGLQQTYDLEVAGEWHNFVANGVVVHNSFRYSGKRIIDVVEGKRELEEVFYLRPVGNYSDRQGKRYEYTEALRQEDLDWCLKASYRYAERIQQGFSEEHARSIIPFDVRQHWVMSANVRSLMHLLDLRWKLDAQLEAQELCELIWTVFQAWVPAVAGWYESNRAKKAKLAP